MLFFFICVNRLFISDFDTMSKNDGYEAWRQNEAVKLSDIMQKTIKAMQNPPDCQIAKKMYCKDYGHGCGIGRV
jgi:hypothetical protein